MGGLGLSLVEKTVFAIIYGFSQDEDSEFHGSRQYLADWCEASTKTIDRALAHLCELRYIVKREKIVSGVKFCRYSVNVATLDKMSIPGTNCPQGRDILGEPTDKMSHNNIDNNADNKLSANRDKSASTAFDFKKAVMELGVTQQHAEDWMAVRKAKRMTNTRTAFDRLKTQIENACKEYGITPDECVAYAASKDWGGFDAKWEDVKNIKTSNYGISKEDRVRAAIDAEVARFSKPLHFGVHSKDQQ
jgi:hypothetical protein